jgi:hypothetical protein
MVPLLNVVCTLSAVRTVGVELFKSWRFGTRLCDNCVGGISLLHARGSHCKGNDQTHHIDNEVTLSPLDLLACIEAAFATLRRAAIVLSINDGRCRRIRASRA